MKKMGLMAMGLLVLGFGAKAVADGCDHCGFERPHYVKFSLDADLNGFEFFFMELKGQSEKMCKLEALEGDVVKEPFESHGKHFDGKMVFKVGLPENPDCYHGVGHHFGTFHFLKKDADSQDHYYVPNGVYSLILNGNCYGKLVVEDQNVQFREWN